MSDYGNGPYYHSGGSGGGGYVNEGSQGSPGEGRKPSHSLRPVTIRQIHDAVQLHTDNEFSFDGVEPTQVVIVAMVISFTIQATNHVYIVHDGTGRIEARQWVDHSEIEDESTYSQKTGIEDNAWVRIIGNVKSFNNKRNIIALSVVPVVKDPHSPTKDMNEVYYHQLEALYTHLYAKYGPDPTMTSATGYGAGQSSSGVKSERGIPPAYTAGGGGGSHHHAASGSGSDNDPFYTEFSLAARLIHIWMKARSANPPPEGHNFIDIARDVKPELEARGVEDVAAPISDAIDWLSENGYIYAVMDEHHYALA